MYYQIVGDSTPFRRKRAVTEPQYDLVGPDSTSHTITNLETFKQYLISVTAYNIAGEGPVSQPPIIIITDQGCEYSHPPWSISIQYICMHIEKLSAPKYNIEIYNPSRSKLFTGGKFCHFNCDSLHLHNIIILNKLTP